MRESLPIVLHPEWAKPENEEKLMIRLHQIISGTGDGPFKKDSGYRWQLDASNDWFAEVRGDSLIIAYRYGLHKVVLVYSWCEEIFGKPNR